MVKRIIINKNTESKCEFAPLLEEQLSEDLPLEEVKKLISAQNDDELVLAGNGVCLRKDISEIINHAEKSNKRVIIETSGAHFSEPSYCNEFSSKGILFSVSLFTDKESGIAGMFRKSLDGIVNLIKFGLLSRVVLVINNSNYTLLKKIVVILNKLGVRRIMLDFSEPKKGMESLFKKTIPSIHDAFPYINQAVKYTKENGMGLIPNTRNYCYNKDDSLLLGYDKIKPKFEIYKYKENKKASVIIPTYNRRDYLKKTLSALFDQNFLKEEYEIIVVDDNSDDNTREMIKSLVVPCNLKYIYWPRTKKFRSGEPLNRAGPIRNLGAKYADGDIIIFVDCDVVVCKDFIKEHLESQKIAGIVIGPSIREDTGRDVREGYFQVCNDDLKNTDMITWELAHEGNISFKKKEFMVSGGFSDEFVYWAFEGDDLAYRLIKYYGKSITLNRNAKGVHLYHPPEFLDKENQKKGCLYNAEVLYKKHLDEEIYYRFFDDPTLKGKGNIKLCSEMGFSTVPPSMLLSLCVESTKCNNLFLCKCQPHIVSHIIKNRDQKIKTVFFRDDDVGELTENLKKLVDLFLDLKVPVNLQIIPDKLDEESINWLKDKKTKNPALILLNQHGLSHEEKWHNNKPYEFGEMVSYSVQFDKIKKGREKLEKIFGSYFYPVFTPPFHSFDKNTLVALKEAGFKAFSASSEQQPANELINIGIDIDIFDGYYPTPVRKKETGFFSEFVSVKNQKDSIGILLHHDKMVYSDFKVIERLIKLLKMNKSIMFRSFEEIIDKKPNIDVLLINPSYQPHWSMCEPTGLISIASFLNKNSYTTRILDFNVTDFDEDFLSDYIRKNKPAVIGISSLTRQALKSYKLGKFIKKNFPGIEIVYGGVHSTAVWEEPFLNGSADVVVIGEGENTFLEIIKSLKESRYNKEEVKGIAYKDSNGKIIRNKPGEFIENLDIIPVPDYDLVDLSKYNTSIHVIPYENQPAVHIMTTRGCLYNCSYCNSPSLYRQKIRKFSVERVIEELKEIKNKQNISNFHFHDDIFLFDAERVKELCNAILRENLEINWICLDRIELIIKNQDLLPLMKEAGCKGIEIGIESADSDVLAGINKIQKTDEMKKANVLLLENELIPMYLLMSYAPGETLDTPYNNTKFVSGLFGFDITSEKNSCLLDEVSSRLMSHMTRASPGCEFYKTAEEKGVILSRDWNDHYEERINFIPFSFLSDIPCKKEQLKKEEVLFRLNQNIKNIRIFTETNHYLPEDIYSFFSGIEDYLDFVSFVYDMVDGQRSVRALFDDFSKEYTIGLDLFCSAIALLSIYHMIGSELKNYIDYYKSVSGFDGIPRHTVPDTARYKPNMVWKKI